MIEGHFRRHYFQMGLLINFQVAALLALLGLARQPRQALLRDLLPEASRRVRQSFPCLSASGGGPAVVGGSAEARR